MRFVPRALRRVLAQAVRSFPAVVLTGPRRAGKTTLLRHLFPKARYVLQLTEPGCSRTSLWLLPKWFRPTRRDSCLTYHGDPSRWRKLKTGVMLKAAGRGQEFVLDCDDYPEAVSWLSELLMLAAP